MPHPHPNPEVVMELTLEGASPARLACLMGPEDSNLTFIAERLAVSIAHAGPHVLVRGPASEPVQTACQVLRCLFSQTGSEKGKAVHALSPAEVNLCLKECTSMPHSQPPALDPDRPWAAAVDTLHRDLENCSPQLHVKRGRIRPRTPNQADYLTAIMGHAVCFGTGPAGTGKTYLAVAAAVDALERHAVQRIILTRPAVEAGEKLGFLPGDLAQKVDPYLRPLYDALFEMLGYERVEKLIERQIIEIAPLAYMRGRTLNDSFIILDEAQNTTIEQMKMFLTRIGFNSQAVITGDPSQCDLPRPVRSGLGHALQVLQEVRGVRHCTFTAADVVRHPVVAAIVTAYETWERRSHNTLTQPAALPGSAQLAPGSQRPAAGEECHAGSD